MNLCYAGHAARELHLYSLNNHFQGLLCNVFWQSVVNSNDSMRVLEATHEVDCDCL